MNTLTQVFIADLQERLFQEDNFLSTATNYSAQANNEYYNIPNFGLTGSSGLILNPSGTQTAASRNDIKKAVKLDYHGVLPQSFQFDQEMMTNYSLRQTTVNDLSNLIEENVGTEVLARWAKGVDSANVLTVTGGTVSYGAASRSKITKEDILALREKMTKAKVPMNDRYLVIPSEFMSDILAIDELVRMDFTGKTEGTVSGTVGKLYGFTIIERSVAVELDGGVVQGIYDSGTVDQFGAIAYQKGMVSYAAGAPKVFIDAEKAEFIGESILSAGIIAGASVNRVNSEGVYILKTDIV